MTDEMKNFISAWVFAALCWLVVVSAVWKWIDWSMQLIAWAKVHLP
jgi:hypothetical protein